MSGEKQHPIAIAQENAQDSRACLDAVDREERCPCLELNPGSYSRSRSLYLLIYPVFLIRVTDVFKYKTKGKK
jgi:hypothetical protein